MGRRTKKDEPIVESQAVEEPEVKPARPQGPIPGWCRIVNLTNIQGEYHLRDETVKRCGPKYRGSEKHRTEWFPKKLLTPVIHGYVKQGMAEIEDYREGGEIS